MNKRLFWLFGLVVFCLSVSVAKGDVIETLGGPGLTCFNSTNPFSCGGTQDAIWNTGDYISETFSGTGLASVSQLTLNLSLFDTLDAGATDSWAISVNGTEVGTLSATGPGPNGYSDTFNFASISGPDYTIAFTVLSPGVPGSEGTLGLFTGAGSTVTLGARSAVPEPSSLLLLLMGAVASLAAAAVRGKKTIKSTALVRILCGP